MEEPRGTITTNPDCDEEFWAERMKKAMRGIGSDEKAIIRVLVSNDSIQREAIEQKYKSMYGRDLIEDLKNELGGHFEDTVVALLTSKYDFLIKALHESLEVPMFGRHVNILTEVLCCRESEDINSLCWWYENKYARSLEDDLVSNTSGDFKAFIRSMLCADRPSSEDEVNHDKVKKDAQKLYDAGIGYSMNTDEEEFINLFNNRSFSHLHEVFKEYENIAGQTMEKSIDSELSGDIREGLLAIVKRVGDPYEFFAERLHKSMSGAGTDDQTLIRIIVSRSEEDLANIKESYMKLYKTSLASAVEADTSGDYQKLLLAIITQDEGKNKK